MDILEALRAAPTRGVKVCVIQRWLNSINDEQPGKPELTALLTAVDDDDPSYRTRPATLGVLARLGFDTSENAVGIHRAKNCKCFR